MFFAAFHTALALQSLLAVVLCVVVHAMCGLAHTSLATALTTKRKR